MRECVYRGFEKNRSGFREHLPCPSIPPIPPPAMARPAQVRTMGWRVPRAARGLGTEVVVCHSALTTADHDCVVGWRGRA